MSKYDTKRAHRKIITTHHKMRCLVKVFTAYLMLHRIDKINDHKMSNFFVLIGQLDTPVSEGRVTVVHTKSILHSHSS